MIIPMCEDERMTRLAAIALGRKCENWKWDFVNRGLFYANPNNARDYASFAPLTNHADAYVMEDTLEMDVRYVTATTRFGVQTSITIADKRGGGCVFRSPRGSETTLQTRMAAATQYAALCAIMEDAPGAEAAMLRVAGSRGG